MLRSETAVFTVRRYANVASGGHSSSEAAVLIISSTFNIAPPNMYDDKSGVHALIFQKVSIFSAPNVHVHLQIAISGDV